MGVPGFYSWLVRRYPLVKHLIEKQQVPSIDYLYLDMNGIIYKCVKDDSIIFKSQILPKEMEEIWLDVFNYINMLVNILKPNKMIVLGLDGVAPRAKMNNQRSRRFKSSRDHKKFMEKLYGFTGQTQSTQNFKNNSISPGTAFMEELGANLEFFIKKKIEEDDYWKSLSIIFTSSSSPGEGQHKIMEFIRANKDNFNPDDTHCLYGADADLIMLSMTLPLKNLCIIRQEFVPGEDKVKISQSRKEKVINFEMIFVTILREYFQIEYIELKKDMKIPFDLERVIKDFVFLFFFIGNDFLPRCFAYNIRVSSIEDLIDAFKEFLLTTEDYVVGPEKLNIKSLTALANAVAIREGKFIGEKAEEFEKDAKEKNSFNNEFNQLIKQKAMKEQQFINQLKTFYLNDQKGARSIYYGQYFNIDPSQQSTQFYQILNYYLYGLQFVYEYYFINLPSWQWYYPYYCSPLVSDLFYYLTYLSQNNHDLPKLEAGSPFPPFKQLLCILPKQSAELLPAPFRKHLLESNSSLRQPVDFYPDSFQEEQYGSLKEHEYIALIPFLDINIVNKVYDQCIGEVSEKDLRRNKLCSSILYEYDKNAKQIQIESQFKSIPATTCTIQETKINLRESIKWGKNNPQIKPTQKHLFKMPSLKTKNFFSTQLTDKRGKKYFVVEMKNDQDTKFRVGEEVFYGYPLEKSGKIQAILSVQEFMSDNNQFYAGNYEQINKIGDIRDPKILKENPKEAFTYVKEYLMRENKFCLNWSEIKAFIFAQDTQQFVRCLDGNFKRVYRGAEETKYEIIPLPQISKTKTYQNTMDKVSFNSLEEEFGLGENVLVFPSKDKDKAKSYVQKGKVVGYTDSKVKVKLGQKIKQLDDKILSNIVHTRQIYFSLKFCSFILEMKPEVLLTLLESVNIIVSHPQMPPSIDIGLNFINRMDEKLVPNLVRINFENMDDKGNVQKLYRMLDISLKGLELIIEYKTNFPEIFKFIEKRYQKLIENKDANTGKINWREKIELKQIYEEKDKQQEKALKSLMNIYLWLIKKEETHLPLSSIYSKQISVKNIVKLEELLQKVIKQEKQKKHKYSDPEIVEVDPNFLFSRRLSTFGKMHLSRMPSSTTIRDQVVCLHPEFFGQLGVVIGFDYNKFEVMFSKPSFGKTDLNGICGDLWAGRFYERDLFNFQTWPSEMKTRYKTNNSAQNVGWDGGQKEQKIVPKFKEKALRQFADIEKLSQKKIFTPQFLAFIDKAKKNQKVEKIDSDFQVVDTRKGEYAYKYDKGKASIGQEYVEKVVKDKKYMQKPIEPTTIKTEVIQKQIIENKAEKKQEQEPETKLPEHDGEDDGDDMLN